MRLQRNWVGLCLILCLPAGVLSQSKVADEQALEAGRSAINQQDYARAIRILKDAAKEHPDNEALKLELGKAYLYKHQDKQAMALFQEVLLYDPSNRQAKLELARALGYQLDYQASDRFYRDLLSFDAGDEAAAIGLTRNLIHENHLDEARTVCESGLTHHPNSAKLRDYQAQLQSGTATARLSQSTGGEPNPAGQKRRDEVRGGTSYFADSNGNRSWRSSEFFEQQITGRLSTQFHAEERSLWLTGGPRANVLWGSDEMRMQVNRAVSVGAMGGVVRFADGSTRTLYNGELELHPINHLWASGGYRLRPISPTYDAAQFDLLAQGWHSQLEWYPRGWWVDASWSQEHYSDSNRDRRFEGEFLRWIGTSRFAVGAGYQFNYLAFSQTLLHGYFNPSSYYDHLGRGGVRFRLGKVFRAEYLGGAGVESIAGAPYQSAWEMVLKNRIKLENWEFSGDYFYYHLPQSSGAFTSQAGRLSAAYYF